jgi:hypothetical protein
MNINKNLILNIGTDFNYNSDIDIDNNNKINDKKIELEDILIKFKNDLLNYKYIEKEEIKNISIGSSICYFKKNTFKRKTGQIREIKNDDIIQLVSRNRKKIWFLYLDQNHIFLKESNKNKLKIALQTLIDDDFSSLTIKPKKA